MDEITTLHAICKYTHTCCWCRPPVVLAPLLAVVVSSTRRFDASEPGAVAHTTHSALPGRSVLDDACVCSDASAMLGWSVISSEICEETPQLQCPHKCVRDERASNRIVRRRRVLSAFIEWFRVKGWLVVRPRLSIVDRPSQSNDERNECAHNCTCVYTLIVSSVPPAPTR